MLIKRQVNARILNNNNNNKIISEEDIKIVNEDDITLAFCKLRDFKSNNFQR